MSDDSLLHSNPLGQPTLYKTDYDASLLFPIPRHEARKNLPLGDEVSFHGVDIWTAFEISWLNPRGLPQVALAEFYVPSSSPNIVESKSFKLYLNSFNQTRFGSVSEVTETLKADLTNATGQRTGVMLQLLSTMQAENLEGFEGTCIDDQSVVIEHYTPQPSLLTLRDADAHVEEQLFSDLLKTNCPVTGQPDWASVQIRYRGAPIDHKGLLAYIVSFREHQDYHEHCVERMFMDIWDRCRPERLAVYARYTRRGGLDINPFRSSHKGELPSSLRLIRQ